MTFSIGFTKYFEKTSSRILAVRAALVKIKFLIVDLTITKLYMKILHLILVNIYGVKIGFAQ